MKRFLIVLLAAVLVFVLVWFGRSRPKSVDDVSKELTQQFRSQYDAKRPSKPRELKSVRIVDFHATSPSNSPGWLGVELTWNDAIESTSLTMVPLGDGLFGVTYEGRGPSERLAAVLSFR